MLASPSLRHLALALTLAVVAPHALPVAAEEDSDPKLPSRLHLAFTHRTRYESLRNQFRPGSSVDDRAFALRTTLLAEFRFDRVAAGLELADSRLHGEDADTPLNTTLINPLDILQAYVHVSVSGLQIRAGRQTIDLGGRRLLARNRFRNTINSFTGVHAEWTGPRKEVARAFVTMPVQRRPTERASLAGNDAEADDELDSTLFWGLFYGFRPGAGELKKEAYVVGISESDDQTTPSDRDFVTPGFRILREAKPGSLDFEVEAAFQTGSSGLADLRHRAFFMHGEVGRTFRSGWRPRLALLVDHASGDRDPADDRNQRFDTLFGARRFEFGPTGLFGALARSNISSPAIRLEVRPNPKVYSFLAYRPAWLAQARDRWTTTGIQDPSGSSGRFIGHQIEGRVRWEILPKHLRFESGFAYLNLGGFPKSAPNGNPNAGDPLYAYAQLVLKKGTDLFSRQ